MFARIPFLLSLAAGLLFAGAVQALDLPGPLVSTAWLAEHAAEVNILDVREDLAGFTQAPEFSEKDGKRSLAKPGGHIPGALLLDFGKARASRTIDGREIKWLLPPQADFQALLREAGVRAGRPTVIVSNATNGSELDMAARIYWSMKVYGDDGLALLDGGTSAWLAEGRKAATDAARSGAGDWTAGAERMKLFATSGDVAGAAAAGRQLVDARPLAFFVGLEGKGSVKGLGHIAGARDFPPEVRARSSGGASHFLTAAQYRAIFAELGIDPAKPVTTYCNTGHLASGAWFVLSELLGNPDASLYDGSLHEWTAEGRPLVGLP